MTVHSVPCTPNAEHTSPTEQPEQTPLQQQTTATAQSQPQDGNDNMREEQAKAKEGANPDATRAAQVHPTPAGSSASASPPPPRAAKSDSGLEATADSDASASPTPKLVQPQPQARSRAPSRGPSEAGSESSSSSSACCHSTLHSPGLHGECAPSCATRQTPPLCVSEPVSEQEIIVLKVGSASLSADDCSLLHLSNICTLVETICELRKEGFQVILVTSGAVAVGCQRLGLKSRPQRVITKQVVAAIGQSRLMRVYDDLFSAMSQPIAQLLLTRDNLSRRQHYLHALNTFRELLRMGVVPIVNENDTVAVEELRVGDNDTLSARVASLVQAKWLFLLTDVDGLYDSDPRSNPDAKIVHTVKDLAELKVSLGEAGAVGTGGMATKLTAARIATQAGVHTGIIKSTNLEHIRAMMRGEDVGTHFLPADKPLSAHKKWIAHGLAPRSGAVILDPGAAKALKQKKSLFAKGVPGVAGNWAAGDSVRLLQMEEERELAGMESDTSVSSGPHTPRVFPETLLPSLKPVGVAVLNYSSTELSLLAGHHSSEYSSVLGYETQTPEVAHRENIVLMEAPPPPVPHAQPAPSPAKQRAMQRELKKKKIAKAHSDASERKQAFEERRKAVMAN